MAIQKVNVAVSSDYLSRFSDVVERCRVAGLEVEQVLPMIGVITGTVDAQKLAQIQKVEGVNAVEEQTEYQLPPPESDLQ